MKSNNSDVEATRARLAKSGCYRDLSTVMVMPTRGMIPCKTVQSLLALGTPMNQKFTRIFIEGMEVGAAYNYAVECILANPELSKWKYLLTVEEDNVPPPDGLLQLYESMNQFDAVSGLYFVKGPMGAAMAYGDPKVMPRNYIPQIPVPDSVMEVNGIGMGFALFKLDLFRRVPKPWFKTLQQFTPGQGMAAATQDLWFCGEASKVGARFGVDCRVKVGHWDQQNQQLW